ncbi:RHS repeat-associated core domain-containing protein [Serratia fonticola]|uniref:RHS repeat-associated core domain-containing protein n=1 Tax=Serratia fonticola TaxID=47917 RepID=UPI0021ADEEC8|nr:RHS repeat-associated core domain-containing protein [Serratia fonticola]
MHYNRYRYYSPETARFNTPDPIGLAGGLNQTQYVPNPTVLFLKINTGVREGSSHLTTSSNSYV